MNPEIDDDRKAEAMPEPHKRSGETAVMSLSAENVGAGAAETGQSAPPAQAPPMANDTPAVALPLTPMTAAPALAGQHSGLTLPATADDADLIEREWVDKAKEIVERTLGDPREQNEQLNRMKADYLKKRYNKDIKVIDE